MRGWPTSTPTPRVSSRAMESARAARSLRSMVTLPPPHMRSLPLKRTRSATMRYGSLESAVPRYSIVGRLEANNSSVSRTPVTAR